MANGLQIALREDRSLPAVHVAIAALGGQRWEPDEKAGAGNLLAELLDRGTRKRSQTKIAEEAEDLGASLSTFGGRNTFGISLRCLKDDLPKLLDLAADCLLNPSFPADELEEARKETLAKIAEQDEDLFTINSKVLRPLLYGSHPYSRPVLGTAESVPKIAASDLAKLHAAWTRPENLAIAFSGDITPADAVALVRKNFSPFKTTVKFAPPATKIEPLADSKKGEKTQAGIEGAVLTLGFHGAKLLDPDREALDVMAGVLAGLGGRLYVNIREKQGMAYSVGAYSDVQLDGGGFVFYVQTDPEKLAACEKSIWDEIKKLRDEAVTEKELESVKNHLAGQEAIALQDQGDLAQRLALSQLYAEGAASVFQRRERLMKVTAKQVQEAARKYLDPKAWAQAIVRPAAEAKPKE